jgi:hypothetical protein
MNAELPTCTRSPSRRRSIRAEPSPASRASGSASRRRNPVRSWSADTGMVSNVEVALSSARNVVDVGVSEVKVIFMR